MAVMQFITDLVAKGRYSFSSNEAAQALGTSAVATRAALRRLRQKGEIAMPYKGFYVVVPPEYRNVGCLPAGHFLPALMEHLGEKYYAGLLSAAEYHGAAHQRPQVFQVVVAKNKPEMNCGMIRVIFVARKNMERIPTTDFKTPRGYLKISTPEATAYDLVGYPNHGAGLDNVATVLAELAEKLNGKELVRLAGFRPSPGRRGWGISLRGGRRGEDRGTGPIHRDEEPAADPAFAVAPCGRNEPPETLEPPRQYPSGARSMIPQDFIAEWKQTVPWPQNDQVEQDLIICRALVEIFNHPDLQDQLAFRGGTALFKLHLPPLRYSEDIDLVQVYAGPIGPVMSALQGKLNPWLGIPKRKQGEGRVRGVFR